jgi:peptidoglycan/xylan/chitin deacetylase (PgdA/CDA1 family)
VSCASGCCGPGSSAPIPSFLQLADTLERWRRFPGLERLEPGSGRVALTFDDGPDPDATPDLLDALDAAGATATFFLVGEQVMEHGSLAREVADRGHEVALHGFAHVEHDELGGGVRDDLAHGLGVVEAACGRRPRRFRPPYGRFSEASYEACRTLDLEPVYWSAWGGDWEAIPAERIADLATRELEDGVVLALHDSARYAYRESARPTVEALPLIAAAARERGLALGPV